MKDPYEVLVPWCQLEANVPLTDDERWTKLNIQNIVTIQSTPISLRTLMASLTPEEYITAKTILTTAASTNVLIADALAIMSNVGVWEQSGLDIGAASARGLVDTLFTGEFAALGAKIKALAEVSKSQIEMWQADGYNVERGCLPSARVLIEGEVV
jgi:hypothetical protein